LKKVYLKVEFATVQDLVAAKAALIPIVQENIQRQEANEAYLEDDEEDETEDNNNYSEYIDDIREFDIPYYERVSIDMGVRVGNWYEVLFKEGHVSLKHRADLLSRAQPKVLV